MALPARPMHVPAGLPLDESTRPELLDVGKANVSNVNVRMVSKGGLSKRLGFGSLTRDRPDEDGVGGNETRTTGNRLMSHNGAPVIIDGSHLDSYLEAISLNVRRSRVPECTYRLFNGPLPTAAATLYDVEVCAGLAVVTHNKSITGRVTASVVDVASGTIILAPEIIGSGNGIGFVASYGDRYFVAFVYITSSTAIEAYSLDIENLDLGWVPVTTGIASSATIMSVCSLSNRVAIAYGTSSGTSRVTVKTFTTSGVVETTTVNTSSVTPNALDIHGSIAGTLWVTWNESDVVKACGLDADALTTILASTDTVLSVPTNYPSQLRICEGSTAGTARLFAVDDTVVQFDMCDLTTAAGAAVAGTPVSVYNMLPASRPFQQGGRYYVAAYGAATGLDLEDNSQALMLVVDWTENETYVRPVASIEPGLVPTPPRHSKVPAVSSTKRLMAFHAIRSGVGDAIALSLGNGTVGLEFAELDFASRTRWQSAEMGNVTALSGGVTTVYDGERANELGFLHRPTQPQATLSGTGITGTYRYVAIYEDVDASGNWVVSGISDPSDLASPTNKTVTVETKPLTISSRIAKGTTRVAFYRTATGGEPPYYRLAAVENDTSSAVISYADTTADASLTARAKLYAPSLPGTAGESLDRRAPPGLTHLVSYAGMLVGAAGSSLFHSGQEVYGEATWFSPVFQVPISGGGDITALATQDGTLYVFKRRSVYAVAGEAPSDNGASGGLGTPRRLAVDVGCIDSCSVVATSAGVFFQSERGVELLTRGGEVTPIGEPVQDTLASYPVVSSAVLDDRHGLVRFTLAASESGGRVSGNGRTIVFDLAIGGWISVDAVRGGSANQAAQDGAMVYLDDAWRYAWLSTDGTVYYERNEGDASAYLDGSSWVTAQYETPPWKLGMQQEQRVYEMELLFERHSPASISIDVARDFDDYGVGDSKTWSDSATSGQRQVPFRPKPLTTAIQLRISDASPSIGATGNGRGLTFVGVSADIAPKQGSTRGTTRLNTELRR